MTLNVEIEGKRLTLFDVSKNILGYDKMSEVHQKWGEKFEEERKNGRNRFCIIRPRGSYKTSFYNISLVIDLLIDDYVTNGKFTNTILICSSTDTLATNLLSEVMQHLKTNEFLLNIFDPNRTGFIDRINQRGVWFKNRTIKKEANIACIGAGAGLVSSHYSHIICDDICTSLDRDSKSVRESNNRFFDDLISILNPGKESLLLVIGTRWTKMDVLDSIIENNDSMPDKYKYFIEIDGVYDDEGNLKYPTIYNEEEIERLKAEKTKKEFAAQYLNVLLSEDTMIFDYNTFSFYKEGTIDFNYANHFIYTDPSLGKEMDYSVILVGAIYNKDLYIRNAIISNTIKSSELIKQVDRLNKEYCCIKCGLETNGFQSLLLENVKELNITNKKYKKNIINIEEVKNYKNKQIRIESIEPFIVSGRVHFREDWEMVYPLLIEQLVNYPVTNHDDAPDALEGLIRITINNKFRNANLITADKLKQFSKSIKMRR